MNRAYRINDTFEIIGAFWKPITPDDKFTGTLTSNKGRVSLSTAPNYGSAFLSDVDKAMITLRGGPFPRAEGFLGFTQDGECSLLAAIMLNEGGLTDFSTNRKVTNQNYRASAAVMGMHVDSLHTQCIESAGFYFTKIRQALPTPWSMTMQKDGRTYISPSRAINVFQFRSNSLDAEVVCEVFSGGGAKFKKEATVKSVPRVRIIPANPQSLEWYSTIAYRVENFFALILGTSISLKRFQLFRGDRVGWVVQTIRRRDQQFNFQMSVKCDSQLLSSALDKWLSVPDEKRPVEKTLLGMLRKSSVFVETEFLSLAQALEGFNRLQGVSDKTFRRRLEEIYDMLTLDLALKLVGKKDDFVRQVVSTRNFFTHLGEKPNDSVLQTGGALFELNQRLHALLRCVMLIQLGIDESSLRDPILYQSKRYELW